MKKLLALNILIIIVHFPYTFVRWLEMPYVPPTFYLEDVMILGSIALGPFLVLNTILLAIFNYKSEKWKARSLIFNFILLALTLVYVFYAAITISTDGRAVWIDIIALIILALAFRLSRIELAKCTS
jgi:hypothetical protein